MGEREPVRFMVYGLVENTENDHTVKFLGEVETQPHEDAIERAVDGLLGDEWDFDATLVFPADTYWQINAPDRRGAKLGYFTDMNNPRRMRVRL